MRLEREDLWDMRYRVCWEESWEGWERIDGRKESVLEVGVMKICYWRGKFKKYRGGLKRWCDGDIGE